MSHVDHRLLKLFGRSAKLLKPCDGQGTAATGGFEYEYRRNGVSVDVDKAEVKWEAKITERNGQHVDDLPVESSWNGQVQGQHGCGRHDGTSEEELCSVTKNHARTACCSEVSFGALVGGTLVDDGAVCKGLGEESDEKNGLMRRQWASGIVPLVLAKKSSVH
ncbi:hypothetical protein PF005_g1451 [Phytophthora fragariae]|uniref:Uncharacterized protein n=1 Tax=Phytophthora fragariae TaxID=53985 RepID=A0A6A3MDZ4_9STRA|nr:hypothetical protein PF003_g24740 [Phytophthora fragariae]KAE8948875.1 hypothetical protein PF009_g1559 [Phytophthora fragariae]KAE9029716.1 hypothetical protein PF011_g943 [Phytophthora fragariae]KAE9132037.1 hypothetical protein PF010_g3332 [Phytophthora fragariae]KAE9235487.1 hypothetical protein PF005_g1451 [Phytophthora fragariae]